MPGQKDGCKQEGSNNKTCCDPAFGALRELCALIVLERVLAGDEGAHSKTIATQKGKVVVVMTNGSSEQAKNDRAEADADAPANELRNGAAADDGGPEQIKLLFDGQGPEGPGGNDVEDLCEVHDEQRCQQNIAMRVGDEEVDADQAKNIERQNAKNALPIKVAVVGSAGAVLDEQRGDEKSGENKEEIDSVVSKGGQMIKPADARPPVLQADGGIADVMEEDCESSHAAYAIQLADVSEAQLGPLAGFLESVASFRGMVDGRS